VNERVSPLKARLEGVFARMRAAAERVGREAGEIRLVGVTKTVPAGLIREAVALGLRHLGENRVQEAQAKIAELGRIARWHMIGHLQSNKAARAVELFDEVQSVDRASLAGELARRARERGVRMPVLLEVNVSAEATKFGVAPDALGALAEAVRGLGALELRGLMTVGRPVARAEEARADFVRLRTLRDECERRLGLRLPELSMGMSQDFEVAIEEGATYVRVGRAIFGPRA
jgi:pyridoxal phosphate enzyme (YggS family)